MHRLLVVCITVATLLAVPTLSPADRPLESRDKATHVIVGRVTEVCAEEKPSGANRNYIVEIVVEKAERGDGLKSGDTIYASVYMANPHALDGKKLSDKEMKAFLLTVDGGYKAIPKKGDRVRVFVKHGRGKYVGIYPDWMDTLGQDGP
jgi:hypothetical protein